ncbi:MULTISPECIES: SDR family NAD(P)-dependent oxidoreductase [unclassified Sphingomonas]|uniref:SDR family NAD(P)-dependent oxidoreductase n=1 Tax=unclassified Sphingomonas TaxID=196159 RepID=UPI0006FDB0E3|nr:MULTISPECIES: SDR family oxidoreductase [unclassified Sphingomonas]KQX23398.1 hypothetical protein ASD17_03590 [Sphingomonas sp. Root1294]KQY68249.1 hypothetical protein ASD39_06110 [Sphingomonas sp. Root50]KRB91146.1 hypothetical protein ASE22_12910 [Sphingomonas sp. Root720]
MSVSDRPNRTILVTGAGSGIGRAAAVALAASARVRGERPRLLLVDRIEDGLSGTIEALGENAGASVTLIADLAEADSARAIAEAADRHFDGRLDVLVNNAGMLANAPLELLETDMWDRTFAVNARAAWLIARHCHPMLKAAQGCIVATASLSATQPTPPHGAYSASKAALLMLIRQAAYEWGPDGIRCNCVSPGMIHTGMSDAVYSDPAKRAERARHIPLRRIGSPEDVARVIAFLASPEAAYVTGVDIAVDGGVATGLMPTLRGASVPGGER